MSLSKQKHSVSVAKGAALVIAMRWTDRLIGIASTLILARLMAMLLWQIDMSPTLSPPWLLLAQVALGASSYGLTLLALWRLSGCRKGAESYLLDKLRMKQSAVRKLLGHS